MQIGNKELVAGSLLTIIGFLLVSIFFLFHQHVRHKMILKIKCYLSAYNECCEVSVEDAYINMKLRIGNRESGTGNWFLVPYLSKCLGYFKTVKSETGNREAETSSSFWYIILMFQKYKSGKRNQTAKGKLVPYFGILD